MKTMKFLSLAALALTFAACSSNDDELTQLPAEQPANNNMITITAKLAPKSGIAKTRAVSDDGTNIVVDWAANEHIAILYTVGSDKKVADATITDVDGSGVATISFTVESGTPDGTACKLVYPAVLSDGTTTVYNDDKDDAKAYGNILREQNGALSTDLDIRVGAGTIQTTTPSLTVTTQPEPQYSIFKFTLQNLSSTALSVSTFVISDGGGTYTTVTPTTATSELYVALPQLHADTYWFKATATADSKYIAKATVGTATSVGTYYQSTVKMATIGDVIKADGKFYAAGTEDAVAKICYVGSETAEAAYGFNHGLALALSDANGGSTCMWNTSATDAGHTKQTSSTFTEESGLQYNDATHNSDTYPAFKAAITYSPAAPTGCSAWFLASGYQWQKMISAAGLSNLGLSENAVYWSSTEQSAVYAWWLYSNDGSWSPNNKDYVYRVRACLAF